MTSSPGGMPKEPLYLNRMTSKFRTIEVSDPRFETDHLRFITVKTPNLKGRGDICVFSPPGISTGQPVPVILLLHGVYGSAWSWAYGAGVHLQAMKMIESGEIPPVVIAMPSDGLWGDGSRSEEHTSELQSLMRISYAVFCLTKKKQTY